MKKYELVNQLEDGMWQVKALISFGNVNAGELGGWVEKEENLSHMDNAWVYGNAQVSGDAVVYGEAQVYGNAWVYGNAQVSGDAVVYEEVSITPLVLSGLKYVVIVTDKHMRIGCQCHPFNHWLSLTDEQVSYMDGDSGVKFAAEMGTVIRELLKVRMSK